MDFKDLKVGNWYAICCEIDLKQVEGEAELNEIKVDCFESLEDGEEIRYAGFWGTKEEALKDLLDD